VDGDLIFCGEYHIYQVTPLNGAIRLIQARAESVSVAPDNTTLLFANPRQRRTTVLYLFNRFTNQLASFELGGIGLNVGAYASDWSPDGSTIVLEMWNDATNQLFSLSRDCLEQGNCAEITQLTYRTSYTFSHNTNPRYSPDGSQIVFVTKLEAGTVISLMNADGTDQRQLTQVPQDGGLGDSHPDWSPDGRYIIFTRRTATKGTLFIMGTDGSNQREFISLPISQPDWWMSSEDIAASLAEATPAQ
jgi:Tol biopolymer transport system component